MLFRAVIQRMRWQLHLLTLRWAYWCASQYAGVARHHFTCTICGRHCVVPTHVLTRERLTCVGCGSNVRYRAIIHALLRGLECPPVPLRLQQARPAVTGIGMTDSPVYARYLRTCFAYTNTFYHKIPRLDILNVHPWQAHCADFILCSDVLEHVRPPVAQACANLFRLLKPGGLLVVSVPLSGTTQGEEYYPSLHTYRIEKRNGMPVVMNQTIHGTYEEFTTPQFHAGAGETLVMRMFSRDWLLAELAQAGFRTIHCMDEDYPDHGIVWTHDHSVPVLAWKPFSADGEAA